MRSAGRIEIGELLRLAQHPVCGADVELQRGRVVGLDEQRGYPATAGVQLMGPSAIPEFGPGLISNNVPTMRERSIVSRCAAAVDFVNALGIRRTEWIDTGAEHLAVQMAARLNLSDIHVIDVEVPSAPVSGGIFGDFNEGVFQVAAPRRCC